MIGCFRAWFQRDKRQVYPEEIKMLPKSAVAVPLYIYPLTPETWGPLYTAIESNPNLDFLIIVNPNSGPGDLPSPDVNYAREVSRLNTYANVYTVGYIRIDYCRKPLSEAYAEIERYASWSEQCETTRMGLRGIFVDETPNHYAADSAEYLTALTQFVKSAPGILADRMVVHNPGTPPDATMADAADLIFVCEEPYSRYRSNEVQQRLRQLHYDRTCAGFMISEVPIDDLQELVHELRHRSAYIFVTEIADDFYERFGPHSWGKFMRALQ